MMPHTINTTDFPQLMLLKQTSLCEEFVPTKNGHKTLHTVVKNSPFTISFGFDSNAKPVDLNKFNVDVSLHYDSESNKEVDYLKNKPIVVKSSVNPTGSKLSVEVRIKVLTSQLEDSLFLVIVRVVDPFTNETVIKCSSDSIKVISKSDQVKKPKSNQKKRNITDAIGEYLQQIESTSQEHARLLSSLCTNNVPLIEDVKVAITKPVLMPIPTVVKTPDFQDAFKTFLKASSHINPDEKRQRLSNVLSTTPMTSSFLELVDLLRSEVQREQGPKANDGKHGYNLFCNCPGCPYLKELGRIEGFYNDIFSLQNNP